MLKWSRFCARYTNQLFLIDNISKNIQSGLYDTPEWLNQMRRERDHARLIVKAIPLISQSSLNNLNVLSDRLEKLLSHFVEPEIKNENLQDILGNVGASYQRYMEPLLTYVVYSSQTRLYSKPVKPELSRYERNYNGISNYYGKEKIDSIMIKLTNEFVNEGGNDLYYALANSFENAPRVFIEWAIYISWPKEMQLNPEGHQKLPEYIQTMSAYFHQGAEESILKEWSSIKWPIGLEYLAKELEAKDADSQITIDIIKARAFAEFCHKTASYYFGYHYVARDIGKGLLDIPSGLFNTFAHPIQTFIGVGRLFTLNGWSSIGISAWNRPWRLAASITPMVAGGYCAINAASTPTVQAVNTINTIRKVKLLQHVGTLIPTLTTPLTTINAPLVSVQSAAMVISSARSIDTISTVTQNTSRSDAMASSNRVNIESKEEKSAMESTTTSGWDKLWFLLLPDLNQAKTRMDFYKMINALQEELDRPSNSSKTINLTKTDQNRFFSSSSTISSGSDGSSALANSTTYSK